MNGRQIKGGFVAIAAAAVMSAAPSAQASASARDAPCIIQDLTSVYECVNEKINNPPCIIQDITSVYECANTIVHNLLRADR